MELRIGERLILLGILPNEGNFITLKVVRKLQEELSFSEADFKEYDIKLINMEGVVSVPKDCRHFAWLSTKHKVTRFRNVSEAKKWLFLKGDDENEK